MYNCSKACFTTFLYPAFWFSKTNKNPGKKVGPVEKYSGPDLLSVGGGAKFTTHIFLARRWRHFPFGLAASAIVTAILRRVPNHWPLDLALATSRAHPEARIEPMTNRCTKFTSCKKNAAGPNISRCQPNFCGNSQHSDARPCDENFSGEVSEKLPPHFQARSEVLSIFLLFQKPKKWK